MLLFLEPIIIANRIYNTMIIKKALPVLFPHDDPQDVTVSF